MFKYVDDGANFWSVSPQKAFRPFHSLDIMKRDQNSCVKKQSSFPNCTDTCGWRPTRSTIPKSQNLTSWDAQNFSITISSTGALNTSLRVILNHFYSLTFNTRPTLSEVGVLVCLRTQPPNSKINTGHETISQELQTRHTNAFRYSTEVVVFVRINSKLFLLLFYFMFFHSRLKSKLLPTQEYVMYSEKLSCTH